MANTLAPAPLLTRVRGKEAQGGAASQFQGPLLPRSGVARRISPRRLGFASGVFLLEEGDAEQ